MWHAHRAIVRDLLDREESTQKQLETQNVDDVHRYAKDVHRR
jgi:hypothetical protein